MDIAIGKLRLRIDWGWTGLGPITRKELKDYRKWDKWLKEVHYDKLKTKVFKDWDIQLEEPYQKPTMWGQ